MHNRTLEALVSYAVADDRSRVAITFSFPYLSSETYVTILHDTGENATDSYWLTTGGNSLALSIRDREGVTINVWHDADIVAAGVYQVDAYGDGYALRSICSANLDMIQRDASADAHHMGEHSHGYVLHNVSVELVREGRVPSEQVEHEERFAVD
ncbi:MAG: hypothetical protein ABI456_17910 [Ktedonobacteraceae bacterium]